MAQRTPVDVVIPVFRGMAQTRECIESVLAAPVCTPFRVVVVNDASPEPQLVDWLADQAAAGRIELIRNDTNLGFVRSVNRGMALHPDRDVVLLNSDTRVANDWLDRLCRCADSASDIATVTPFSNNATVCSYPFEGWTGDLPGTLGLARIDGLFSRVLADRAAELPTAIGFCMFIRRRCLDEIGLFDVEAFGRGYGEENDFSMRAAQAGWRNVLAADVFVFHHGAVSFGDERFGLMQAAEHALLARHPRYNDIVRAFISADPLADMRDEIDRARIAEGLEEALCVLEERRGELRLLRDHRVAAPPCAPSLPTEPPRSMRELWGEFLSEGSKRAQTSSRWGPVRRRLAARVLKTLYAVSTPRRDQ